MHGEDRERQAEQDRLLSLRDFAYGASHELNNPLANIVSRAESLLRDETDFERRRKLATIVAQAFRAHEMIADLMHFARPPALVRAPVDVDKLVADVVSELRSDAAERDVELVVSCQARLIISADASQLAAALRAIGRNALEASSSGDRVDVEAIASPVTADGAPPIAEIRVTDRGAGFPAEVRRRLFHPFYSGREAGRGLGLGLSKAWRIVDDHEGEIDIVNSSSVGVCVVLRLKAHPRDNSDS